MGKNDEGQEVEGIAKDYMDLLEKHTGSIKCKKDILPFGGSGSGVGHSAFIQEMHNCSKTRMSNHSSICACELGMGGWIENEKRFELVHFLQPFVYTSFRVVVRRSDTFTPTKGTYFLSAFTLNVWLLIIGLIVLFTMLKVLDKRFMPPDNNFKPLPDTEPFIKRVFHYALKSHLLRRIRKAIMSTCK